ncbi:MAG: hypothetical protein QG574_5093 [Cyanobacteriota bacterium erpe_2018_sw_21hr_WHONDRS-SW48-000092_B_bin.40]|jgi:hypothetical protein|nr:hypothetical protein [Cyanobacteriota bacterium erpe_2018_sw_21hr_WHONDRS-SW48-000092_B_bin.40]
MLFSSSSEKPVSKAMTGSVAFALFCQLFFASSVSADTVYSQHSPDFDPFAEHAAVVAGSTQTASSTVSAPVAHAIGSYGQSTSVNVAPPAGAITMRPTNLPLSSLHTVASNGTIVPMKGSVNRYQPKNKRPQCHGDAVLPMMVHMAMRPELIEAKYLRTILGAPDNKGSSGFGMSSLNWRAKQLGGPSFVLQNGSASFANKQTIPVAHPLATSKTFVALFPHSGMQLKHVKKQLGEPVRQYFDNNAQPVECYQLSPNALLTFTEPVNCFDVTQMAVVYDGPPLPAPSTQDYAVANQCRLTVARQHLASGDTVRCAELLNEHLKDNPLDAGAHLILAKTMKHYGDINGAIDEYKNALTLARTYGVPSVENEAYSALTYFGVVAPAPVYGNTNNNLNAPAAVAGKKLAGRSTHRS